MTTKPNNKNNSIITNDNSFNRKLNSNSNWFDKLTVIDTGLSNQHVKEEEEEEEENKKKKKEYLNEDNCFKKPNNCFDCINYNDSTDIVYYSNDICWRKTFWKNNNNKFNNCCDLTSVGSLNSPREYDSFVSFSSSSASYSASYSTSVVATINNNNNNNNNNYKTEMCRTWIDYNYCPYNDKCKFAHGRKEITNKTGNTKNYKLKQCKSFHSSAGYCPYGYRCQFKHDERKLTKMNLSYFFWKLQIQKIQLSTNQSNCTNNNTNTNANNTNNTNDNAGNFNKRLPVFESLKSKHQKFSNFSSKSIILSSKILKEQVLTF